jgi:hypothetical protein
MTSGPNIQFIAIILGSSNSGYMIGRYEDIPIDVLPLL